MNTHEWNQARRDLALAIRDSLDSYCLSYPDMIISGLGIHVDGCGGDMGLYLLPENAELEADLDVNEISNWPIATDWDQEQEFANVFLDKWDQWSSTISEQLDEISEEECEFVFQKLLETACCALSDLEAGGLLTRLNTTENFLVIISEHDEPVEYGVERYELFKKTSTIRVFGENE